MNSESHRLEWILLIITGLAVFVTLAMYVLAERELNRRYDVSLQPIEVPEGPAAVAEGERQAMIRGCFWCHGAALEGQMYFAEADRGLIVVAPDLTRIVNRVSPAEFARTVRHGVRPDGTSLQPAMPSFAFYNMSDADMGSIIAYIKSLPQQDGYDGQFNLLPVGWYLQEHQESVTVTAGHTVLYTPSSR